MRAVGILRALAISSVIVGLFGCGGSSDESGSRTSSNNVTNVDTGTDPGTAESFSFANDRYTLDEGQAVTITVNRSTTTGQASVMYGTQGITARHPIDYAGYEWTELFFYEGESSKTIRLQTINDDLAEGNETLNVLLDYPSNGYAVAGSASTQVTIRDNDLAPVDNAAPTINGSPMTSITEGMQYDFTPAVSDPDSVTLFFSISNQPGWASFDNTTGRLFGVPSTINVGNHPDIIITVSDGVSEASLPAFSITVNPASSSNAPPSINGNPATSVIANSPYSFTPGATDPDSPNLVFSIVNRPYWAFFNSATGELSGTPADSVAGTTFSNIIISVSDGVSEATLPAFSITVNPVPAADGSTTLRWTAPTTNVDGSNLTDLAGYIISFGTDPLNLNQDVPINDPAATEFLIENLPTQVTVYFGIKAVDAIGQQSNMSNVIGRFIQ